MTLPHVHLLGFNAGTGYKILWTAIVFGVAILVRFVIVWLVRLISGKQENERAVFWTRQAVAIVVAVIVVVGVISIWFDNPQHLTTAAGLIGAGLAFALQKVVTAFAGYLVILRGKTFTVGDRISMGGVRGDVISLGFLQTRIMEMGEPTASASSDDKMWIHSRQFTGRLVSVTNDKVFDEPIYNFTREFPFIWDEIRIPITYATDRRAVEAILLEAANEVAHDIAEMSEEGRRALEREYFVDLDDVEPKVYYKLTDNWLELTLRFLARTHGVRELKDRLSRLILDRFDEAHIGLASATYDVVGFPPIRLEGPVAERIAGALEQPQAPARRSA